jgi:hypothetical protein
MTTTTIITRLYADTKAANAVRNRLLGAKFRTADVEVVSANEGEKAAALAARLKKAWVHESAAKAYAEKIAGGAAALVVQANYRPLEARRIAREIIAGSTPIDSGAAPEEHDVKMPLEDPSLFPSVLKDHRLFFRIDGDPGTGREPQSFSKLFGLRTLTQWRMPGKALSHREGPMIPFKTLNTRPRKKSVMRDHPLFSKRLGWATIKSR